MVRVIWQIQGILNETQTRQYCVRWQANHQWFSPIVIPMVLPFHFKALYRSMVIVRVSHLHFWTMAGIYQLKETLRYFRRAERLLCNHVQPKPKPASWPSLDRWYLFIKSSFRLIPQSYRQGNNVVNYYHISCWLITAMSVQKRCTEAREISTQTQSKIWQKLWRS